MVRVSDGVAASSAWSLRAEGLTVRRKRTVLVRALDWAHRAGRIAWVVGENGAGKTSLLRVLAGLARPTAGTVALLGPAGRPPRRLYYHPDTRLPPRATVGEWRRMTAALDAGAEKLEMARPGPTLAPDVPPGRLLGRLSTGEAKRLLLDTLLRRAAAFVFLDEPYEHLSTEARSALTDVLLARAAVSVVVVATNQPVPERAAGPVLRLDGTGAGSERLEEVAS